MQLFVKNSVIFSLIAIALAIGGLLMPSNPKVFGSLLFAQIDKDSLLAYTPPKRLILIGGSNLSFGIDSKMLKDSLQVNPINTGIHASFGLKYMLDHSKKFIRKGDLIIISPEYPQYYGSYCYGGDELLRVVFDVSRADALNLSFRQWINLMPFMPSYISSKFNIMDRLYPGKQETVIYQRESFNQYGDVTAHWNQPPVHFDAFGPELNPYNPGAISEITAFNAEARKIGAVVYVTYPGFQKTSFKHAASTIAYAEQELRKTHLNILGSPGRYEFDDTLFFNTPYHLNREGTRLRTRLLIQDLKSFPLHNN